jgi:hypothetical protein
MVSLLRICLANEKRGTADPGPFGAREPGSGYVLVYFDGGACPLGCTR